MSFFEELKRRNVFRVGVAYIVASWVILQVADLVLEAIHAPDWVLQAMMLLMVLGFFAAVIIAWAYEMTPEGIKREWDVGREKREKGSEPFSPTGTVQSPDEKDEKRALTPFQTPFHVKLRRKNGLNPYAPGFGEGAKN